MFNNQRPRLDDLPTSGQLVRATLTAGAIAGALLVAVVLPAEYAIDPTGIGGVLGLTEMGEIKVQLAEEAASDAMVDRVASDAAATEVVAQAAAGGDAAAEVAGRNDVSTLTLAPGEGAEIKVSASKGARIGFDWSVSGGLVNYDTHGDPVSAPKGFYHGYGKGKQSAGERGTFVAAFNGKHGWFWRNRSDGPVTITLRTRGEYSEVKRLV